MSLQLVGRPCRQSKVETVEKTVHESLKCLRCSFESEWHEGELKEAERCYNGCLWNVCFIHRNGMKATDQVNLGESGLAFEHCSVALYVGDRIAVMLLS